MDVALNTLVNLIIHHYFRDLNCVFIFTDNTGHFWYNFSIPAVIFRCNYSTVDEKLIFRSYGCQGFVVESKNPQVIFNNIEISAKYQNDRFNYRKYIFVPTDETHFNTESIFKSKFSYYVSDIIVIEDGSKFNDSSWNNLVAIKNNTEDTRPLYLYTHKYIGTNNHTLKILVEKWFYCNQSFLYGSPIFLDKQTNQMGRTLKIATFTYKPYSLPDKDPWKSDGTELKLIQLYAKTHNMSLELVIDEKGQWGVIYENWTGVGIIGNLVEDKADIGLGALYTWQHEYNFLDLSKPILRTGITVLVPAPRLAGGLATPILSYSYTMWIAVFTSFIIATTTMFLIKLRKNQVKKCSRVKTFGSNQFLYDTELSSTFKILYTSTMITTAAFLQQSTPRFLIPTDKVSKILLSCVLLYSLLLANSYNSGLASSMTIPRYIGAIHTVQDLANTDVKVGATSKAWLNSIENETQAKYLAILNKFIEANETELRKLGQKRFGFLIERLPGENFAIGSYVSNDTIKHLRLLHEDLYWEQCVFMLRKNSILLPSIDEFILKVQQAGLITYWQTLVVIKHLDGNVQKAAKISGTHEARKTQGSQLELADVEGAFAIWGFGMMISLLIFVVEIYIYRRKLKQLLFVL